MKKGIAKNLIVRTLLAACCLAMCCLTYIYLRHFPLYVQILLLAAFLTMTFVSVFVNWHKHAVIFKTTVLIIVFSACLLVGYILLYQTGMLEKLTSAEELQAWIHSSGQWGIVVFFLITLFQVVVLPIPAAVTVLIGDFFYGPTISFLVSTVGTLVGSAISFLLGRYFGKKLVYWILGKEKVDHYADIITNKGKMLFVFMMLLPFFPDDLLCMTAGLTAMTFRYFMIIISLTRPVMIAFYAYFGSGEIIPFSDRGIPVWIAIFCLMIAIVILSHKLVQMVHERSSEREQLDNACGRLMRPKKSEYAPTTTPKPKCTEEMARDERLERFPLIEPVDDPRTQIDKTKTNR